MSSEALEGTAEAADRAPLMPGPIVLASASRTRRRLLDQAGVVYVADAADLDEAALRTAARERDEDAEASALALAAAKAVAISRLRPEAVVIGADQILECDGIWFEKPNDPETARRALLTLRDRRHRLVSGVAVAQAGGCHWRHVDVATMTMRPFSSAFLSHYPGTPAPRMRSTRWPATASKGRACCSSRRRTATSSPSSACRCSPCSPTCATRASCWPSACVSLAWQTWTSR